MDGTIDWLEPANWEIVDRELCNLMDRLDKEVTLEVVFADGALSGGHGIEGVGCEKVDSAHIMLLGGMRAKGGVVKIRREEELR